METSWKEIDNTMQWKKKRTKSPLVNQEEFDSEHWEPILRCSICNGEQVAGFKNRHTGEFKAGTLIQNEKELRKFMEQYGINEITKEY